MAQRVVVSLSDDLDGGEAAETIVFGIDGKSFEIDLSAVNADKLRSALSPYVVAGRKHARSGKVYKRTAVAPDPAAVRAWARSNGFDVPPRGRIPKKVYEAFNEAS
ncbi:Lsr2 family protein [Streptomyces sp. H10-C2]|uniref:histone-like nucleoid-structuring protein Lsr2 n=1 Tax=unclassified Streptomyces TaxID=2593676 RepID=UPI0024B8830B|nr:MULTISPECIES: Lsr2 family protein [unclassified Streptomyces]MDJ0344998.1 Lsr2 family protein [Streptomyces sp. PH10-H1]MDJ0373921.1 Lsr2 family protein [Streptomyces sp. H10-C2]